MKKAVLILALLTMATQALASRPDCGDFSDRNKYYFDTMGNIIWYPDINTLTDQGLTNLKTLQYFHRMDRAFKYHNSQLVVLPLAPFGWTFASKIDPNEARGTVFANLLEPGYLAKRLTANQQRLKIFRSAGLTVADFIGTALPILNADPNLEIYNPQDTHWTPDGAKIASAAVTTELTVVNPQLRKLIKTKQFDVKQGTFPFFKNGGWPAVIRRACPNIDWTPISENIRTAESVRLDEVGLLDEQEDPPVVVLGSSYSTPMLGFISYLQKDLGAEVENAFLSAGGIYGAMREYFESNGSKPWAKLYIWEFPDSLTFRDIGFRQVMPLLLPSAEIERGDFVISGKEANYNLKSSAASGSQYALEISLEQAQGREIAVELTYANSSETVELSKPRGDIPKRFFVELDGSTSLKSVRIAFADPVKGNVQLVVRKYDQDAYEMGF